MKTSVRMIGRYAIRVSIAVCFCAGIAIAQSPSPTPVPHKEIKRWFDIEALTVATRYRYVETNAGLTTSAQQYQVNARWRFKFDRNGKYSVVGVLATGNNIGSGWNNTGWGTGDVQGDFPVKQLYFEAKPIKQVEIQFGGIAPNNGENTEITGYDNDTYIVGERVKILYPKKLYFDEISATNAFIGDTLQPNVFRRFKRLKEANYHQILVRKKINDRASFSADYTYEAGMDMLRQGVKLTVPELQLVDTVRFENYQQIDPRPGYGFALSGEKKATNRLSFVGGISKISHVLFNGDRFPRGTRVYLNTTYKVTREFSISPVIIHAIGPLATGSLPRTRFELIASYNILEALRHYKIF